MNVYISGLYQQADAEGTSVFVSSGDESSAECDDRGQNATHGISVSGFMSTPYNVSVGGTDFSDTFHNTTKHYWNADNDANYGSAKSYIPEMPWADSCANAALSQSQGFATPYGSDGFCNSPDAASDLTTAGGSGGAERLRHGCRDHREHGQRHLRRLCQAGVAGAGRRAERRRARPRPTLL